MAVRGRVATETVRGPNLRHVIFGNNSCILCEVWDCWYGAVLIKIRICSDVTFRKIVLPLWSASSSQRRVVALHDGVCCTDQDTATFISVTVLARIEGALVETVGLMDFVNTI